MDPYAGKQIRSNRLVATTSRAPTSIANRKVSAHLELHAFRDVEIETVPELPGERARSIEGLDEASKRG